MCGVVGIWSPSEEGRRLPSLLSEMTRTLRHRGPDHQGEWRDDRLPFGLGQRRLSIVDLTSDGHQPMISASGRYVVSFNGEIYNFSSLREDLENRGCVFRSRSDTEVLLYAIETWGLNATCQKINGMFAILLWDRDRRELHLIRDRMGKKPLYFGWAGNDFVCASEVRAFLAHPDFNRRLSAAGLSHYLHLGYIPAPYSIFADIYMLLPGCRMVVSVEKLSTGQDLRSLMEAYWSPARIVEDARRQGQKMLSRNYPERVLLTEKIIEKAVTDRMIADVPLGAFLSGGIDSSLVVSLMQKNSDRPVKTYTIGFAEQGYDESVHADRIARHLGTDHHHQNLNPDDALSVLMELPRLCDEPVADVSFLPTYLVSKFARHDVTVALSGDGGDEIFGGYHRHVQMAKILRLMNLVPAGVRRNLGPSLIRIVSNFVEIFGVKGPQFHTRLSKMSAVLSMRCLPDIYELLAGQGELNEITAYPRVGFDYPFRASSAWPSTLSVPEWMMFADTIHYLPGDVLTKVDRASMAVSLEVRSPLLDMNVFAQGWFLPLSDKISQGKGKRILRDILARHIPRDLFEREKQGFTVPVGDWLNGPLRAECERALQDGTLSALGIDPESINNLWRDHVSGTNRQSQTIWRLFVLSRWINAYIRI